MHSETPQKLPEKPGEPGGEKARLTVPDELVREICADVMIGTYGQLAGLGAARRAVANRIDEWLAGALAARALAEALEWHTLGKEHDCKLYPERWECRRIVQLRAALERAAEGKALGKPEGRAT